MTKQPRGDTLFGSKLLDIVISHPVAQSEPRVVDTPGFAAHIAALKKEDLDYNNVAIPVGHMVPLSVETCGRLDGSFSNFLKELLDFGESPVRLDRGGRVRES